MIKKIIMPSAGQTTDTATVAQICVKVGDKIGRGHIVAEVETDKATLPVESFAAGYVCAVHVKEFDIIDAGALMFEIGDEADLEAVKSGNTAEEKAPENAAASTEAVPAEAAPAEPVVESAPKFEAAPAPVSEFVAPATVAAAKEANPAMPSAKKLAAELGVDLASVIASNGSFIKPSDVKAAAALMARPASPAIISAPYDFSALRDYISYVTDVIGIPSAAVTVKRGHEQLYYCQAGVQDRATGEPLRSDALYYMYSCSKVVTCVAALKLLERGKFLLLDPVSDYLPEYADIEYSRGSYSQPVKHQLLIRDLFTMSSGMNYNLATANINDVAEATSGRCPTREIARAIAKSPLNFDPSTQFLYGLSHDVLAALVEVVSGMRFSDFVKKEIFEPLGMCDSCYHIEQIDKSRMAAQYRYNDRTRTAQPIPLTNSYVIGPDYDSGGAGMISTLRDMSIFADMLACGGIGETGARILSPATIDLMRENQLDAVRLDDFHRAFPQFRGYGYGLGVRTHIDRTAGSLAPLGEFGWAGAAGAYIGIDPKNQLSIFYVQHMLNSQERIVHPRIRNIVYASLGL